MTINMTTEKRTANTFCDSSDCMTALCQLSHMLDLTVVATNK